MGRSIHPGRTLHGNERRLRSGDRRRRYDRPHRLRALRGPGMNVAVEPHPEGATFAVRAQPGGRKNAVRGVHDGCLKVSVTAAPEKGKANDAVLDVLCE